MKDLDDDWCAADVHSPRKTLDWLRWRSALGSFIFRFPRFSARPLTTSSLCWLTHINNQAVHKTKYCAADIAITLFLLLLSMRLIISNVSDWDVEHDCEHLVTYPCQFMSSTNCWLATCRQSERNVSGPALKNLYSHNDQVAPVGPFQASFRCQWRHPVVTSS